MFEFLCGRDKIIQKRANNIILFVFNWLELKEQIAQEFKQK